MTTQKQSGALILLYHSVPGPEAKGWVDPRYAVSPDKFEDQMRFLARRRHVISMTELVQTIKRGDPLEQESVVITFDDGYRDNLEVAAQILASYGLKATIYLPTGYVTRGENQWIDRLYVMFKTRRKQRLALGEHLPKAFDLRAWTSASRAYLSVEKLLLSCSWAERESLLKVIETQLCPAYAPPRLTLTWGDVKQLLTHFPFFEIGVHTRDHIDLPAFDTRTAQSELTQCVRDVEDTLDLTPHHFSFPYGRSNLETRTLVGRMGFHSASVTQPILQEIEGIELFALPRLQSPRSFTQFRYWITGGSGAHRIAVKASD